jgi:hypothetical protein
VTDSVTNLVSCKLCEKQYPGCIQCSSTNTLCEKCGTDATGNQLYLLVDESTKTSCSLCNDDQLKKDSSTGKGGYE